MRPATETMIKLLGRTDRKRRRLFLVERTTSHIIRPALLQRNLLVDNIDNIDFGQKLVNEIGWNHSSADAYGWDKRFQTTFYLKRSSENGISNRFENKVRIITCIQDKNSTLTKPTP